MDRPLAAPPLNSPWRVPLGLLAAIFVVRLVLAATTGIVEDEAYYWVWAQNLAAGYYDHPPAVAWMIAASDAFFGATSLGVRGAGVLLGVAAVLPLLVLAGDARLLVLLLGAIPLYTLGGILATPDVPLLFGWALALSGAIRRRWVLAGLGLGIAGLGKYTGWGLAPLLLLATVDDAILTGDRRQIVGILGSFLIGFLIVLPNLWWNATHDWISIGFQLSHGLGGKAPPGIGGSLEFLGAQVALVSPILFLAMVLCWWKFAPGIRGEAERGNRAARFGFWTSLPVLLFFCLAASRARGEVNWAAPAWLGASLGLSFAGGRTARVAWVGGGFAAILSLLVIAHLYVPLVEIKGDPTARLGVGSVLAASVQAWGVEPVYTSRYQEAALLTYYQDLEAYALPGVDRPDQYDLWPIRWADEALFVRSFRGGSTLSTDPFCSRRGSPNVVTEYNLDESVFDRWQVFEVGACGPRVSP